MARGWSLRSAAAIQSERTFAAEDEACATAWAELKPFDTPVRTRGPEDRARAREMVAEYDQIEQDYRGRVGQQS